MVEDELFLIEYAGIYRLQADSATLVPVLQLPADEDGWAEHGIEAYAIHNGWIYYVSETSYQTESSKLYKVKADGTEKVLLRDLGRFPTWDFIGAMDDAVIITEGEGLSRISLDGQTSETIHTFERSNGGASGTAFAQIIDDDVYYTENFSQLYKLNIHTLEKTFITDDANPNDIVIEGEWIYYSQYIQPNYNEGISPLYRIQTDGTGKEQLSDGKNHEPMVAGNMLYFTKYEGDGWSAFEASFYRMKTDGTGVEIIDQENQSLNNEESILIGENLLKSENVNGIFIGMAVEEAAGIMGNPDNEGTEAFIVEEDDCGDYDTYGLLHLYESTKSELFYMDNTDDHEFALSIACFGPDSGAKTSRGVGVGSTREEVLVAYQDEYNASHIKGFEDQLIVVGSRNCGMVFFLDEATGIVRSIVMGSAYGYSYVY